MHRYELEIKQRDLIPEEAQLPKKGWRLIIENMLKRVAHNEECKICEKIRKQRIIHKRRCNKFPNFRHTLTSKLRSNSNNCFSNFNKEAINNNSIFSVSKNQYSVLFSSKILSLSFF